MTKEACLAGPIKLLLSESALINFYDNLNDIAAVSTMDSPTLIDKPKGLKYSGTYGGGTGGSSTAGASPPAGAFSYPSAAASLSTIPAPSAG